jgi:hypothetical protein
MNQKKIPNGNALTAWGITLLVTGLILFLLLCLWRAVEGYVPNSLMAFGMIIVFAVPLGVILLIAGGVNKSRAKRYQGCVGLIPHELDLVNLATVLNCSCMQVENDIRRMLKKGYLSGVTLDKGTKKLVSTSTQQVQPGGFPRQPQADAASMVTVICPGCGAPNGLPLGMTGECAYCGGVIEGK